MSSRPVSPKSLDELISSLERLNWDGRADLENIDFLVSSYQSNKSDWEKFAKTRPGDAYTRNHVFEKDGKFNVLILCWQPKQGSKIHGHQGSDCFLKVLQGEFKEEQFFMPEGEGCPLQLKQEKIYTLNEVNNMTDEKGLHRVTNNHDSILAVSLHVYVPPFAECRWYEEHNGKENIAQMSYYSYRGEIKGDSNALADSKSASMCKDGGSQCGDRSDARSCQAGSARAVCSREPCTGSGKTSGCGQCCHDTKQCSC
ncbi:unnamed protein product [Lymnaea stagnalis]|uniref:Cysteine dioxygenase n=1 Tax=Lymnaea stagnalis TaxID=6523 RepID=A0AAV2H8K9_LYMST